MEKDRFRMLAVCPYPLDQQKNVSGVSANMLTIIPELESAKGYKITLVGPNTSDGHNEADETFGLSFPIKMSKTSYKAGVSLNLPTAKGIINRANPDLAWFHDPFAAPLSTFTLLLAIDSKKRATDALFHAYTGNFTLSNKTIITLGTHLRFRDFVLNRLDGRAAVSPPSAKMWSLINDEKEESYDILPNPIDIKLFNPDGAVFDDWIKNNEKIIFFAGRHDKRKGLPYLINAFHELVKDDLTRHEKTNLRLKLTGYGDQTELIKKMVKDLGIGHLVEFLGIISTDNVAKAYRTVGVSRGTVVAPSIDGEAFNRSIAEARASGAKVVATNIEGHRFSYGDEKVFGEMAEPRNFRDLAQKIVKQLNLPQEETNLRGSEGVLFAADNFSVSRIADKVVAHHEKIINTKSRVERVIYRRGH